MAAGITDTLLSMRNVVEARSRGAYKKRIRLPGESDTDQLGLDSRDCAGRLDWLRLIPLVRRQLRSWHPLHRPHSLPGQLWCRSGTMAGRVANSPSLFDCVGGYCAGQTQKFKL